MQAVSSAIGVSGAPPGVAANDVTKDAVNYVTKDVVNDDDAPAAIRVTTPAATDASGNTANGAASYVANEAANNVIAPNYAAKAVRGVGIVGLLVVAAHVLSYVTRVIFARYLSPEDYGLFWAVFSFVMFFLVFRDFGLGSAVIRFIPRYKVQEDFAAIKTIITAALIFQVFSSSLLALGLILLSSRLSMDYFKSPQAAPIIFIIALYVIFSMLTRLADNILNGFQETKWYAWTQTVRVGSALVLFFPLFFLGYGVLAPAIAYVGAIIFTFLFLLPGLWKYRFILKYPLKDFWKTTRELFAFAVPVIFTGSGNKVVANFDILLLTYFVSLAEVGVYNVILPAALLFLFLPRAVSMVLSPMTSELVAKNDQHRLREGFRITHTYPLLLSLPVILSAFVLAEPFISIPFGEEYAVAIPAFRVLLAGVLFYIVAATNYSMITSLGKPFIVTKIAGAAAAVSVIANITLIPIIGIMGGAIATAASYTLALVLSTVRLQKLLEASSPWGIWAKLLSAGAVFLAVAFAVLGISAIPFWPRAVLAIAAALGAYAGMVFALGAVRIFEVKRFIRMAVKKQGYWK